MFSCTSIHICATIFAEHHTSNWCRLYTFITVSSQTPCLSMPTPFYKPPSFTLEGTKLLLHFAFTNYAMHLYGEQCTSCSCIYINGVYTETNRFAEHVVLLFFTIKHTTVSITYTNPVSHPPPPVRLLLLAQNA